MADVERKPHLIKYCPLARQAGCDWTIVTSWFVGGPDTTEAVSMLTQQFQTEAHLMEVHYPVARQYFT